MITQRALWALILGALVVPLALAAPAAATAPAQIALFDDPDYVDSSDPCGESDNVQASLRARGHSVTTFAAQSPDATRAVLEGKDVLVVPELENGDFSGDIPEEVQQVLRDFVNSGHGIVFFGSSPAGPAINEIFGFSTADDNSSEGPYPKQPGATGTEFAGAPDALEYADDTTSLYDLPSGSRVVYSDDEGHANVAVIPYGDGSITFLGYDWFDSNADPEECGAPPAETAAWEGILDRAVFQPVAAVNDVSVTEGNAGTTPAAFAVTLDSPVSEIVKVDYRSDNGTAAEPADFAAATGQLSYDRGTTSQNATVNVNGDTDVEPDEGFTLALPGKRGAVIGDGTGQGTILNDDAPPVAVPAADTVRPVVSIAGLSRGCARRTIRPRVIVRDASSLRRVRVFVDGRRVAQRRTKRFSLRLNIRRLKTGGHRIRVTATDSAGNTGSRRRVFRRCGARRAVRPRFTG